MLTICKLVIAFVAGVGFLFGQVFTGFFSVAATLAGVAGLACAAGAHWLAANPQAQMPWIVWAALLTFIGVAIDVIHYYMYLAISGNYYPWFLVGPFVLCVVWVGLTAYKRRNRQRP